MTLPPARRGAARDPRRQAAPGAGRGVGVLLSDFGHALPTVPTPAPTPGRERLFGLRRQPRGPARAYRGWAPNTPAVSVWTMTSDQLPALWPLLPGPGLPATGARLGCDHHSGGSFFFDPIGWTLNPNVTVTNPNVFVSGKPGKGKSATIKAACLRLMPYGYRTLVLGDTKGEYEPLCRALGVEPIVIGPGLPGRVNPLDLGPMATGWAALGREQAQVRAQQVFARHLVLLRALIGAGRCGDSRVPVTPSDEIVLAHALRDLTGYATGATTLREVTIPELWAAIDNPTKALVARCRYARRQDFLDGTRLLRDALAALLTGPLAGMFDAPTTISIDWAAPIQSLSLRALLGLGEDAVGVALTCLNSWGRGQRETSQPGDLRIVLRDEVWMQMRLGPDSVKSLDADLRFSRNEGEIQVMAMHKPSDPLAAGDTGSQAQLIAKDLVHLADTHVMLGQDKGVADEFATLMNLSDIEHDLITGWAMTGTGRALWRVGDASYKVQTVLHPRERVLFDTNTALTGPTRRTRA